MIWRVREVAAGSETTEERTGLIIDDYCCFGELTTESILSFSFLCLRILLLKKSEKAGLFWSMGWFWNALESNSYRTLYFLPGGKL